MKFNKLFVPLIVLLGLASASASLQPGAKWGPENDKALLDRLHQAQPLPLNDPDVLRMDSIYKKEGEIRMDMDQKRPPRAQLMPIEQDILKAARPEVKKFVGDRMRQLPPVGASANQPPLQQIGQGVKNLGTQVGNEVKNIGIKVGNTLGITKPSKPKQPMSSADKPGPYQR